MTRTSDEHDIDDAAGRRRLTQLFDYLHAYVQLRQPTVRQIRDQPWQLALRSIPEHPSVVHGQPPATTESVGEASESPAVAGDDFVLRVSRPGLTNPPPPPPELDGWLVESAWRQHDLDPHQACQTLASRNELDEDRLSRVVHFDDDPARVAALDQWRSQHGMWAIAERPARAAFDLYERVYQLHGDLARDGGRSELVLGDGILEYDSPGGRVRHPILLQRLTLEFDSNVPELVFRQTDDPPELYSALFNDVVSMRPERIASARDELAQHPYHPLGIDSGPFLQRLAHDLSPTGTYVEANQSPERDASLTISRQPYIFRRQRNLGFVTALDGIREDLKNREPDTLPQALLRIVGTYPSIPEQAEVSSAGELHADTWANEDEDVLFSKPANAEQLKIARRLAQHGAVLVQGPPGTGKTHTIANLVGHLLAEGKRVLITSHTTKALAVLHDQIVEPLRPLCLSVLDTDVGSRQQLEFSVRSIVARLSDDAETLQRDAARLAERRRQITQQLRALRLKLLEARASEYLPLVLGGDALTPSEAARIVASGRDVHAWIPGPIPEADPLPLAPADLVPSPRSR